MLPSTCHLVLEEVAEEPTYRHASPFYSTVIGYYVMAIVQKKMRVKRSIYEMLQIVSISLTDTTPLKDLFVKPDCNIVNELDGYSEPTLFDF